MWRTEIAALSLLDSYGGPFSTTAFRSSVVATIPQWRDVSIGARHADGSLAAMSLLARKRAGDSVPPSGYGSFVATRELHSAETVALLEFALRERRLRRLEARWLDLVGSSIGRKFATASIVSINRGSSPADGYGRLAHRSLKRARAAGATVTASESADVFWPLYESAAIGRASRYPEALIRRLLEVGAARVHAVKLDGNPVAVLLTLVTGAHWMCWLAGQSRPGRSIAASYLAYDALLTEAHRFGVAVVNLGASTGGGAEFKHHLGAEEVDMREWSGETLSGATVRHAHQLVRSAMSFATRARLRR